MREIDYKVTDRTVGLWSEDPSDFAFLHSVFTQCSLPYRSQGDRTTYIRKSGNAGLVVNANPYLDPDSGDLVQPGLPYGSKPRLVLLHACTEAVRRADRAIPISDSLTGYLRRDLEVSTDGKTLRGYKDQLGRLSRASVTFSFKDGPDKLVVQDAKPFSKLELWGLGHENQRELWPSVLTLGEEFFASLSAHAVPLDQRAIRAIQHSSRSLDLYVWLAHRLHRVKDRKGQFVSYQALASQFGGDMKTDTPARLQDFKEELIKSLVLTMKAYPKAKLHKERGGLRLFNSPPPVKTLSVPKGDTSALL